MVKKIFLLGILILLITSFGSALVIEDLDNKVTETSAQTNSQINQLRAEISELKAQIIASDQAQQSRDSNLMHRSDLDQMYEITHNQINEGTTQVIINNIVLVILAFALMFLAKSKRVM